MLFTTILLLQTAVAQTPAAGQSFEGAGRPAVAIPRLTPAITIDGALTEPEWSQAARLTGFHQYQPGDGIPADERTETRVFYSQDAIYFAIIAHAKDPATIRATIADRDNLGNDDRHRKGEHRPQFLPDVVEGRDHRRDRMMSQRM